jgi:hypothetical protein
MDNAHQISCRWGQFFFPLTAGLGRYSQRGESLRHSLTGSEGPPSPAGPSEVSWGLRLGFRFFALCEALTARATSGSGFARALYCGQVRNIC